MKNNQINLSKEIIERSLKKDWHLAKNEWTVEDFYYTKDPTTCLCGHSPVNKVCILKNKFTGKEVEVGNVCVTKFMEMNTNQLFESVSKIDFDPTKSISSKTIDHFYKKGVITGSDMLFYHDIRLKRGLTEKQLIWKININEKILDTIDTV